MAQNDYGSNVPDSQEPTYNRRGLFRLAGRVAAAGAAARLARLVGRVTAVGAAAELAGCGLVADSVRQELTEDDLAYHVLGLTLGNTDALKTEVPELKRWMQARNSASMQRGNTAIFTDEVIGRVDDLERVVNTADATLVLNPGDYTPSGHDNPFTLVLNPATGNAEYHVRGQIEGLDEETYDGHTRLLWTTGQLRTDYRLASDRDAPQDIVVRPVEAIRFEFQGDELQLLVRNLLFSHLAGNPNYVEQKWDTLDPFATRRTTDLAKTATEYAQGLVADKTVVATVDDPEEVPHGYCVRLDNGDHLAFRADAQPDAARPHTAGAFHDVVFPTNNRDTRDALMTLVSRTEDNTRSKTLHVVTGHDLITHGDGQTAVYMRGPYLQATKIHPDQATSTLIRGLGTATTEEFIAPLRSTMDAYRASVRPQPEAPQNTEQQPPANPPPSGTETAPPAGTETTPPPGSGTETPPPDEPPPDVPPPNNPGQGGQ